jgi:hypothetical protein
MASRYPIRVDPLFRGLFAVVGAPARRDYVELDGTTVTVRLGWAFRATIPVGAITAARHHADMFGGWGAHGFRGRWLVNGSSKGIVELDLEPRQRAWLLGAVPIRLRILYLSVADPNGFLAELAPSETPLSNVVQA